MDLIDSSSAASAMNATRELVCVTNATSQDTSPGSARLQLSFLKRNGRQEPRDYRRRPREDDDQPDRKPKEVDEERKPRYSKDQKSVHGSDSENERPVKKPKDRKDSYSGDDLKNKRKRSDSRSEKSKDSF